MPKESRFAFIVGAPRCGTTTLAGFLQQHPKVCFSAVKEPHYFSFHDLAGLSEAEVRDHVGREYLQRFFGQCDNSQVLRAEGSVTYLYAPEKMAPVLKLWPDAKFIIALRDPLQMLPSLHARLLVTGDETIRDFAEAWSMIGERAKGRSIPRTAVDPRFLRYDQAGALGTHVEKFLATVGPERCHIVLFDDLSADPQGTYARLCGFLGIDPWSGTDFEPLRIHKTVRMLWLQRLLKRPPKFVRTVLAGQQYRVREKKLNAKDNGVHAAIFAARMRLLEWNKVPARREPLDPAVKQRIIDAMRDEVILLSQVIDRDLSHWLGGVPEAKPQAAKRRA